MSVINDLVYTTGPRFVTRDLKTFIQQSGMIHVQTIPYYPQTNGKIERWHKSLERECIRPATPLFQEGACQSVNRFVMVYDRKRLRVAPLAMCHPAISLNVASPPSLPSADASLQRPAGEKPVTQPSRPKVSMAEQSGQDRDG